MTQVTRSTGNEGHARPAAGSAEASRPRPILLIEDTPSLQMVYRSVLASAGHRVAVAGTAAEGLSRFRETLPNVVLLDLMLPDRNGLDLMQDMLRLRPETNVIVITANGSINKAVEAMRAGAHEFLVKPFDEQRFLGAVENASLAREARPARRPPPQPAGPAPVTGAFLGSSEAMARIHAKIRSAARSMATIFITGESGTGKELCALAVHDTSPRAAGPFIALNCGAIPQDLLESEVFGHVKGSFTGAIADKPGAAAAADGGTLFLDEICEMAPALQTKLLRFLQTSMVQPVGATRPRKVNVRIVCATNRDPLDAVRRGHFREDLYYRLFVVPIHMPPLRDRGNDVIEIAEAALSRFAAEEGREFFGLDAEVKALFRRHPWPGNVRQVLNVIRNVVVLNEGGLVTMRMLPDAFTDHPSLPEDLPPPSLPTTDEPTLDGLIGRTLAEIEQIVIEATIARHGGSVPKAARMLDVSPSTLYRKREAWKS
ncbi:sigma-54-dependent Fis family transcriptional regulator [Cereibacter sphaeroides]|uniref:sigma-54-dependent transcriptional regulator n=1 Tax=Cereibacter sphaeroides TaxID=1063 RepID=UPI000F54B8A7|nr:sigma-54 dependent transcriptional regulator [Cereibacter sphaeroides]AZB63163.1 sigma-54-dependent Fis family transcriptional regulator [Cereibacter sphaeroides]AZB67035.1 sigma-54-dependent Fis family transcriptional regulator [Cereibacter sphaeroides]